MDESLRHFNPNPTLNANIFSKLLFCWLNPLLKKGRTNPLEIEDMYNVVNEDSSERLGTDLEREWLKEVKKGKDSGGRAKPSLLKALVRMFGVRYMLLGIVIFIEEAVRVVQPLLLGGLIRYFTPNSHVSITEAYSYAMGVSLCAIVIAIAHHPYFFGVTRMGMQMRVACCSLMYKKALRLSNTAMGLTTTGQIVNLMSNDVNRFDQAVIFLHFLWIGPLQAIAVLVILWHELGPSVLAGFAVLLLLIPVQGTMGKLFSKLRRKTAQHTDERLKVMNEIIAGMRVIKMYCWEKPFGELVEKIRSAASFAMFLAYLSTMTRRELNVRWGYARLQVCRSTLFYLGNRILTACVLVPYLLAGPIADRMFLAMMLVVNFNRVVNLLTMEVVEEIAKVSVALERLQRFLLLDELDKRHSNILHSDLRPKTDNCGVVVDHLTAKWNPVYDLNTLEDVSTSVAAGKLLAVIGPVGSGKSSLLMAILGELQAISGKVAVKGKVAYVSQQPWIFSGSLRQNIIFGSPYDQARFERVVKASALHKDLEIMPYGDSTLIGDRGVSLSGGQRARVSLARALYTDADVFLLDDPLSAVDAAVGRHIFDKCICGVLRKKPRILVTHQLQYLTAADCILILNEGKAVGMGSYEYLSNSGIDFAALLKSNEEDNTPSDIIDGPKPSLSDNRPQSYVTPTTVSQMSLVSSVSEFEPEAVQLPEEEERQSGTVGLQVYVQYFKAGAGIFKFTLLVLFNIIAQCTYILSDWWLSRWSNEEEGRIAALRRQQQELSDSYNHTDLYNHTNHYNHTVTIIIPEVDSYRNIYIFTGIIIAVFVFGLVRALLFFKVAVDASQKLHNIMFAKILRTPIGFFDTNPVGRILNRFAKDVGHMDDNLPITFFDFIQCFLLIVGIVLVAGIVNPWVFIPTVPIVCLFIYIRNYYLSTSRSIKRLEGTCRSPVFSYLSASLQGLHTIRAFSMEEKCHQEFDAHQDLHSEAWFLFLSTSRWLAVRLDWLCAIFVTAVTFCAVLSAASLDAGLVGLSITYSMTLMGMFQWGVRQSAEVENQMISVERVLQYSRLPEEAPLESDPKHKPPDNWPKGGTIEADSVCLQYFANSPLVLKGLTFRIREKEKVGIVGRTGAGKSSLITCLFRLVEPTGRIRIDGVDILKLGLHDLRKNISIIPQDPVLFTGTLRKNLDPFQKYNDSLLWQALEEVQLKGAVEDLPSGLETSVSEGGVNFSVGQRQLICLARAVLGRTHILMIDEATANVDPKTDELIQATIRDKFRDCTVLTIAHRLHTIMDSDRVMVLSEGQIVELEAPHLLLLRRAGMLYDMVQHTGRAEAEQLALVAKESYERSSWQDKRLAWDVSNNAITLHDSDIGVKALSFAPVQNHAPSTRNKEDTTVVAPLALAESYHSLLCGGYISEEEGEGEEEEEEEEDNDGSRGAGEERGGGSDSTRDGGYNTPDRDEGGGHSPPPPPPTPLPGADESRDENHTQLDALAFAFQAVVQSKTPATQKSFGFSPVLADNIAADNSFEDDVFVEGPSDESAVSLLPRSNFKPSISPGNSRGDTRMSKHDDDSRNMGDKSGSGSSCGFGSESGPLLRDESGISTDHDVQLSFSEVVEDRDTSSGIATHLDTPGSDSNPFPADGDEPVTTHPAAVLVDARQQPSCHLATEGNDIQDAAFTDDDDDSETEPFIGQSKGGLTSKGGRESKTIRDGVLPPLSSNDTRKMDKGLDQKSGPSVFSEKAADAGGQETSVRDGSELDALIFPGSQGAGDSSILS